MWPTSAPTLIAVPRASIASRNSAKLSKGQSLADARRAARRATCPRRSRACAGSGRGARAASARCRSRSCPITTVVTPCQGEMREHAVPEHLRVVVGVDVDEARRDDAAARRRACARALPRTSPSAAMRPSRIAEVAARAPARRCRRPGCRRGSRGRRSRSCAPPRDVRVRPARHHKRPASAAGCPRPRVSAQCFSAWATSSAWTSASSLRALRSCAPAAGSARARSCRRRSRS